MDRVLASVGGISLHRIRNGSLSPDDRQSQSIARLLAARLIELDERFEYATAIGRRNARPVIEDADDVRRRQDDSALDHEAGAVGRRLLAERDVDDRLRSMGLHAHLLRGELVLLFADGDTVSVGAPKVGGATVKLEVLAHDKDDKVLIFKRKRRKGYRKKQGHRQGFTEVRIGDITLG